VTTMVSIFYFERTHVIISFLQAHTTL
jgi:hypothetical protein